MGIPLAALAIHPQQNMLDQFSEVQGIQGQQQQQQLRQQQIQSATLQNQMQQQQLKDSQLFMQSLQKSGGDWDKALDDASHNGMSGEGYMQYGHQLLEHKQQVMKLQTDQLTNQSKMYDSLDGELQGFKALAPQDQATQWPAVRQRVAQIAPQLGNVLPQNPPNSDQLNAFDAMLLGGKTSAENELKKRQVTAQESEAEARITTAKTGQQKLEAEMNPQSSLYAPSPASVAMGTAPGAEGIKAGEVNLAARKSAAEAAAKQPFEIALAKIKQAITQGDPTAAAQLLVGGDATLSQLKARGVTPEFIQQTLNEAKRISNGAFNAQKAEADFNVAKSPENVRFFGSAKSLTDPGGTLDQLEAAAKNIPGGKIPVFNSIADAMEKARGSGPLAKYAAIAVGASDDYSKVMGGGIGSDSSRLQGLNLIPADASPEARHGAVEGIRGAVGSQTNSRIGNNSVMQKMYGGGPNAPISPTHKVGDTVSYKGQQHVIQAINPDGSLVLK